ncbi:MAG: sigma-70 family RNA polymerase sigma factor [Deltaproteobacteria bacterium]|nr:sigma-70 family RNA polymerase sigma factor [Deltaproteobacteria bacterium]
MAARSTAHSTILPRRPKSGTTIEMVKEHGSSVEPPKGRVEAPENFLARYFKEMSHLRVLKPEDEFDSARAIEAMELELWQHLFSYPQMVEPILAACEKALEEPVAQLAVLRRAAKGLRASSNVATKRRYKALHTQVAGQVHAADVDRCALFAALSEVRSVARGESEAIDEGRVSVNVRSKAFQSYMRTSREKFASSQRLRNDFVKANLRLVVSIARRFNHGRMPLSDLIQEGNIGLIKAVERYDYRRGFRFSTYASWWIRHAISRALADKGRAVRLPVHMIDAYHKVAKTRRELANKFGRQSSSEEVAEESGIALDKVRKLDGFLMEQAVSLDREVSDDDGRRFVDFIEDVDAALPSDRIMTESLNIQVTALMRDLKPIESDILRKRFGLQGGREQTLKEIGQDYNLSRERIRQLQEQALGKIRRALHRQDAM